jgi:hypothetical protein
MDYISINSIDILFTDYKDIILTNINDNIIDDNIIDDNIIDDNIIDDNIGNTIINSLNKQHTKVKKILCTKNKCNFKNYKENLCRFHYNKTYNLLCSVKYCNNIKKKNNLCYKHIKPLCCVIYCKCYALTNEKLCKKHNKFKIEKFI